MRTTIIIRKRGEGYIADVSGRSGSRLRGSRCGLTPYEAATNAARWMIEHAQGNPEGGDLMAPPEVLEHVPEHLRCIAPGNIDEGVTLEWQEPGHEE